MNGDIITSFLRHMVVVLGARHKERLGGGIAVGLVILLLLWYMITLMKLPMAPDLILVGGSIALGIIIRFIPLWFSDQGNYGEEDRRILDLMDELSRRADLSPQQRKIAYNRLLHHLTANYYPDQPLKLEQAATAAVDEAAQDPR